MISLCSPCTSFLSHSPVFSKIVHLPLGGVIKKFFPQKSSKLVTLRRRAVSECPPKIVGYWWMLPSFKARKIDLFKKKFAQIEPSGQKFLKFWITFAIWRRASTFKQRFILGYIYAYHPSPTLYWAIYTHTTHPIPYTGLYIRIPPTSHLILGLYTHTTHLPPYTGLYIGKIVRIISMMGNSMWQTGRQTGR